MIPNFPGGNAIWNCSNEYLFDAPLVRCGKYFSSGSTITHAATGASSVSAFPFRERIALGCGWR
jgi:hypothetical protein